MKVAHLTSVHPPFDTRIFHKECRSLSERYEVVLLAQYDRDEVVQGVRVRGVGIAKNRRSRVSRIVPKVFLAALRERASLYHLHDPELLPVGMLLKAMGKRVVYDVHEDVPRQIMSKGWIDPRLRRIASVGASMTETLASFLFDGIVTATAHIAHRFPAHKTVVVQNFPIPGELEPPAPLPYQQRPLSVAYVGDVSALRGLKEMVEAMSRLGGWPGARLVIAGPLHPQSIEAETLTRRADYRGWCSRVQVAEILGQARIGLLVLHPTANYVTAQPTKLYEYMSAGIPVIASDFPAWREVVSVAQCGLLVDPLDVRAITDAIDRIFRDTNAAEAMGARGRDYVRSHFSWVTESDRLARLYEKILKRTVR